MMPSMPWTLILSAVATATSLVAISLVIAGNRTSRQLAHREGYWEGYAVCNGLDAAAVVHEDGQYRCRLCEGTCDTLQENLHEPGCVVAKRLEALVRS